MFHEASCLTNQAGGLRAVRFFRKRRLVLNSHKHISTTHKPTTVRDRPPMVRTTSAGVSPIQTAQLARRAVSAGITLPPAQCTLPCRS